MSDLITANTDSSDSDLHIFVDADACPVKEEVYRVARRCGIRVTLVANSEMAIPDEVWLDLRIVANWFDAADDWIVEQTGHDDIVITVDIPLADRCLKKGSRVLGHKGREFTHDNIGSALATRAVMSHLRDMDEHHGGPSPSQRKTGLNFFKKWIKSFNQFVENEKLES